MYKLYKSSLSNEVIGLINLDTKACIPIDEANTDYQQYLAWLEQGNQPLPADEEKQ